MSKSIRITDEAFEVLAELSQGFENPSKTIVRVCTEYKKLTALPVWNGSCSCNSPKATLRPTSDARFINMHCCSECKRIYKLEE